MSHYIWGHDGNDSYPELFDNIIGFVKDKGNFSISNNIEIKIDA